MVTAALIRGPCTRCRPAIVSHISVDQPDDLKCMRQHWEVNLDLHLPDAIPFTVHVQHVDDCDAGASAYPSCCVLAPGGLSYKSHKAGSHEEALVLKQLAGQSQASLHAQGVFLSHHPVYAAVCIACCLGTCLRCDISILHSTSLQRQYGPIRT